MEKANLGRELNTLLVNLENGVAVITFNRPQGGLFVTAFLPEGMDAWSFVQEGIARKVATVPGVAFVMDQNVPSNAFRMNFSMPSLDQIDQGTDILGKLTYEWCK